MPEAVSLIGSERSELSKVLDAMSSERRRDLGLDVVAALLDGGYRVSGAVGQVPPGWTLVIVMMEALLSLADVLHLAGGTVEAIPLNTDEWLHHKDHPRRRYIVRRYGAAFVGRIEKAFQADKAAVADPLLQLGSQVGPLVDALSLVLAIAGGDPLQGAERPPDERWDGVLSDLAEALGVATPNLDGRAPDPVESVTRFLNDIDPILTRKYRGARQALESDNPDRVSQAANSLVELIDRLLRLIASEKEVLEWCRDAEDDGLMYEVSPGVYRPTKEGQFRYFVNIFIGSYNIAVAAESGTQDIRLAIVLAGQRVRRAAERQKHADDGDVVTGTAVVRSLLRGVESVLYVVAEMQNLKRFPPERLTTYFESLSPRFSRLAELATKLGSLADPSLAPIGGVRPA